MSKKNTEVAVVSEQALAELRASFPVEQGISRVFLPRLGMYSQDKFEGKGKNATLVKEAGMFFKELQVDEIDPETGKKRWNHEDLGKEIEGFIIYQRKQLRMFDEATEEYSSTPIYDNEDDILPLFKDKKEVAKGTPAELKAMYEFEKDGKKKSKLEDNRILYILLDDDRVYQLNLRGSSMFAWLTYARKVSPPTVLTNFGSEPKEKGSIEWNQMTFTAKRGITPDELNSIGQKVKDIREGIDAEKNYFASRKDADIPF